MGAALRRTAATFGICLLVLAASAALAQSATGSEFHLLGVANTSVSRESAPVLDGRSFPNEPPELTQVRTAPPQMAPDLALVTYLSNAHRQLEDLGAYTDTTVIEADLPGSKQHGKLELRRTYLAPRSLAFSALHFAGDTFVKTNVIARLLQSEVDHAQKGEGARTAIIGDNYKFNYKGTEISGGNILYVYQVKPRSKRVGLFKGRILIDASTGHLRRAEGTMVKTPSLFVKKVEFVQDYADFGAYSLPVHIHSVAKTRIVGRAVVDIYHERYQAKTAAEVQSESADSGSAGGASGSN